VINKLSNKTTQKLRAKLSKRRLSRHLLKRWARGDRLP